MKALGRHLIRKFTVLKPGKKFPEPKGKSPSRKIPRQTRFALFIKICAISEVFSGSDLSDDMRLAIEGLTDQELTDLQVDFTNLAQIIPDEIQISGEIITNDKATVMAKLPDNETGKLELKEFETHETKRRLADFDG